MLTISIEESTLIVELLVKRIRLLEDDNSRLLAGKKKAERRASRFAKKFFDLKGKFSHLENQFSELQVEKEILQGQNWRREKEWIAEQSEYYVDPESGEIISCCDAQGMRNYWTE